MARSLRPSALRRNISLTQRIGTLSAGIGSPSLAGRGSLCGSTSDRAPPPPRGGADFKSESVADLDRNEWPTSNRNQWPASNRNGWPTSVEIRIPQLGMSRIPITSDIEVNSFEVTPVPSHACAFGLSLGVNASLYTS